jgi:diguanylate cyclase (GGDEF)-like protein
VDTLSDTDRTLSGIDQAPSDTDQALSDTDQTLSDADQALSDTDQAGEDAGQIASDRDQAAADRDHDMRPPESEAGETSYLQSRGDRVATSLQRYAAGRERSASSHERDITSDRRDQAARERDETIRSRLAEAAELDQQPASAKEASLLVELEKLRVASANERARAAAERLERAKDREDAARERGRLEAELRSAHVDSLTGAFRREMGPAAIANEIERMRRSGGSMVVAYVDVDGLKPINDNEGHEAGDGVLRTVVRVIQQRFRPYDSVIRYGGDEFVCVLGGIDIAQAENSFASIATAIHEEARVTVSVGFATRADGDTPESMVSRADAAMLEVKRRRYSA